MTFAFAALLVTILALIAWVDWRRLVIPDSLNLLLAVTGLAYQAWASPSAAWVHVVAGTGMLAAFWLVRHVHRAATGRLGLGLGDVKMAGASALWLSPFSLPMFIFMASLSGLMFALGRQLATRQIAAHERLPFGPFLALGLAVTWGFEHQRIAWGGLAV